MSYTEASWSAASTSAMLSAAASAVPISDPNRMTTRTGIAPLEIIWFGYPN